MLHYQALGALSIPTLSSTMLILLSLLLFIVAFKVSKSKGAKAGKMFITLLGVTALASGIGGVKVLSDAKAAIEILDLPLINNSGQVSLHLGYNLFENRNEGKTLKITSVIKPEGAESCTTAIEAKPALAAKATVVGCAVNVQIPFGTQCHIYCEGGYYEGH